MKQRHWQKRLQEVAGEIVTTPKLTLQEFEFFKLRLAMVLLRLKSE